MKASPQEGHSSRLHSDAFAWSRSCSSWAPSTKLHTGAANSSPHAGHVAFTSPWNDTPAIIRLAGSARQAAEVLLDRGVVRGGARLAQRALELLAQLGRRPVVVGAGQADA